MNLLAAILIFLLTILLGGCDQEKIGRVDKRDQENLGTCADAFRKCIKESGDHCMVEAVRCREPFYTTPGEWALITQSSKASNRTTP